MGLSQLEYLYGLDYKKFSLNDRKFKIEEKKLIIRYVRQSGVSTLIFDHLQNYKKDEYLYIDFNDIRIDTPQIMLQIDEFIKKKRVILLILENFDFKYQVPNCEEIIITTQEDKNITGFKKKDLFGLDFEEFLSFEKKFTAIEQAFNNFANNGTYPQIYTTSNPNRIKLLQQIITSTVDNKKELKILKILSKYQSTKVSLYKLFKELKEELKISKDIFYHYVKKLQDSRHIIMVEKFSKKNSVKKIYLIDFTIKNALSFEKDFIKRFENIVFLELYKRDYKLFYTDEIDIFLPNEKKGIFCIPFLPTNLLKTKIVKRKKYFKKLSIYKIEIITLGNEGNFTDDGILYDIIPFWNWANSLS